MNFELKTLVLSAAVAHKCDSRWCCRCPRASRRKADALSALVGADDQAGRP